jgi:hypothetical protein
MSAPEMTNPFDDGVWLSIVPTVVTDVGTSPEVNNLKLGAPLPLVGPANT